MMLDHGELDAQTVAAIAKAEADPTLTLTVTPAARDWLALTGYDPLYGARPLRRLIQREVDDRIADLFVTGELTDGGTVTETSARAGAARPG